jgi:hypothetical protein
MVARIITNPVWSHPTSGGLGTRDSVSGAALPGSAESTLISRLQHTHAHACRTAFISLVDAPMIATAILISSRLVYIVPSTLLLLATDSRFVLSEHTLRVCGLVDCLGWQTAPGVKSGRGLHRNPRHHPHHRRHPSQATLLRRLSRTARTSLALGSRLCRNATWRVRRRRRPAAKRAG